MAVAPLPLLLCCAGYAAIFNSTYWAGRWLSPQFCPSYNTLEREKGEQGYWAASVTGVLHALAISLLSIVALLDNPSFVSSEDLTQTTVLSDASCQMFIGYVSQDLLLSAYFGTLWPGWQANVVHHVCVLATWWQLAAGGYCHGLAVLSTLCELSTPFVNSRWMLDKSGMKQSRVYFVNGLAMLALFFVFRVCLYSWVGIRGLQLRAEMSPRHCIASWGPTARPPAAAAQAALPTVLLVVMVPCYFAGLLLQLFWFLKILQGAIKVLTAKPAKPPAYEGLRAAEEGGPEDLK